MGLQDKTEEVGDLTLSSNLPVALGQIIWQPFQPCDVDPILFGAVGHPISELGVLGGLERHTLVEPIVTAFKVGQTIIMNSHRLTNLNKMDIT